MKSFKQFLEQIVPVKTPGSTIPGTIKIDTDTAQQRRDRRIRSLETQTGKAVKFD